MAWYSQPNEAATSDGLKTTLELVSIDRPLQILGIYRDGLNPTGLVTVLCRSLESLRLVHMTACNRAIYPKHRTGAFWELGGPRWIMRGEPYAAGRGTSNCLALPSFL